MTKPDYYQTLGVSKTATADELKKAFRKLAMEHHPDRNQGDANAEKKFKEVNEAYEILKDDQKRAAYDQYGHSAFQPGAGGGRSRSGFSGFEGDFSDLSDIFGGMFHEFAGANKGSKKRRSHSIRGSDLRYNIEISLEDAFHGVKRHVRYKTAVMCTDCEGKGAQKNSSYTTCLACGGAGTVRSQQGFFTVESTCRTCSGIGTVIKDPCRTCHGQGRVEKYKEIDVEIPAGIEDETKMRVAGAGEAGVKGGEVGDLYIFVSIQSHPIFKRKGDDLYCDLPVKMTAVALGAKVDVPCLDGSTASFTVPAGTQNGTLFKFAKKGMPIFKKSKASGNLYAKVKIEIPVNLTHKQQELLEQFEKESKKGSSPESEGFFDKVKAFWRDRK